MNAQRVWDANVEGAVHVTSPMMVDVTAEEYKSIPLVQYEGWRVGRRRATPGVKAQETTRPHLLKAGRFTLKSGPSPDPTCSNEESIRNQYGMGDPGRVSGSRISGQCRS